MQSVQYHSEKNIVPQIPDTPMDLHGNHTVGHEANGPASVADYISKVNSQIPYLKALIKHLQSVTGT
jgi:hypothetical protein